MFVPMRNVFIVRNETRNEVLLRRRVPDGFEFSTKIRHSVQLTPVYEYYEAERGGGLVVKGTKLQDLGWGMPSTETSPVVFKDGYMEIANGVRKLDVLRFRVSRINDPMLIIGERQIDLNALVGDGELLTIGVRREPFFSLPLKGDIDVF